MQTALETGDFETIDGNHHDLRGRMGFFGPPAPYVDPAQSVMEELSRSRGFIRDLEAKVRDLEAQELEWVRVSELREKRFGGPGGDYDLVREEIRAEINVWWQLLERERKHYAAVANAAIRSGLEERRVLLAERQVDAIEAAVVAALGDLGLDPQDGGVRRAIGSRLRQAIEGGGGAEGSVDGLNTVVRPPARVPIAGETATPRPVDF